MTPAKKLNQMTQPSIVSAEAEVDDSSKTAVNMPPLGNVSDDELQESDHFKQEMTNLAMHASRTSFFEA